jgi:cell division protein FtsN
MPKTYRRKKSAYGQKSTGFGSGKIIIGVVIALLIAIIYWQHEARAPEKTLGAAANTTTAQTKANQTRSSVLATTTTAKAPTVPIHPQQPEFDFYTVLPKMQVQPPNAAPNTGMAKPPALAQVTAAATQSPNPINAASVQPAVTIVPSTAPLASQPPPSPAPLIQPTTDNVAPQPIMAQPKVTPTPPANNHPAMGEHYALQVASVKDYADADRLKAQLTMLGFDVSIQKYTLNGQTWNRVYAGSYNSRDAALKQQNALKQNNIASILVKQP